MSINESRNDAILLVNTFQKRGIQFLFVRCIKAPTSSARGMHHQQDIMKRVTACLRHEFANTHPSSTDRKQPSKMIFIIHCRGIYKFRKGIISKIFKGELEMYTSAARVFNHS